MAIWWIFIQLYFGGPGAAKRWRNKEQSIQKMKSNVSLSRTVAWRKTSIRIQEWWGIRGSETTGNNLNVKVFHTLTLLSMATPWNFDWQQVSPCFWTIFCKLSYRLDQYYQHYPLDRCILPDTIWQKLPNKDVYFVTTEFFFFYNFPIHIEWHNMRIKVMHIQLQQYLDHHQQ